MIHVLQTIRTTERAMRKSIVTALAALSAILMGPALAQAPAGNAIEEIITVGTRTVGRVATDSPVPVDAFDADAFDRVLSY